MVWLRCMNSKALLCKANKLELPGKVLPSKVTRFILDCVENRSDAGSDGGTGRKKTSS